MTRAGSQVRSQVLRVTWSDLKRKQRRRLRKTNPGLNRRKTKEEMKENKASKTENLSKDETASKTEQKSEDVGEEDVV